MATAVSGRGPDDRRPSVLAPSETGRVRGEAALPAHRAGGRIPVGGSGLRARLAYITAATTAIAALAFLIPLAWQVRHRPPPSGGARRSPARWSPGPAARVSTPRPPPPGAIRWCTNRAPTIPPAPLP